MFDTDRGAGLNAAEWANLGSRALAFEDVIGPYRSFLHRGPK
jgi:hypothetical protein